MTAASRRVIKVEPNTRFARTWTRISSCIYLYLESRGSSPALSLDVCGNRGAERSLAYEG
jgi:hypothetical protein